MIQTTQTKAVGSGGVGTQACIQNGVKPAFGNSAVRRVMGKLVEYAPGQDIPASLSGKFSRMGELLRSKNENTRMKAVEKLVAKKEVDALVAIASYCEHADCRLAAVEALAGNWDALENVARYNVSNAAGIAAIERMMKDGVTEEIPLGSEVVRAVIGRMEISEEGVGKITSTNLHEDELVERLLNIAKFAGRVNVAMAAVNQCDGIGAMLVEIACKSNHSKVRMAAIGKLNKAVNQLAVARDSIYADSRERAIDILTGEGMTFDEGTLKTLGVTFNTKQLAVVNEYLSRKKAAAVEEYVNSNAELFDGLIERSLGKRA